MSGFEHKAKEMLHSLKGEGEKKEHHSSQHKEPHSDDPTDVGAPSESEQTDPTDVGAPSESRNSDPTDI